MSIENINVCGTYFVTSDGDSPGKLCFSLQEAKASEDSYIDVFNKLGEHIGAFKAEFGQDVLGNGVMYSMFTGYRLMDSDDE